MYYTKDKLKELQFSVTHITDDWFSDRISNTDDKISRLQDVVDTLIDVLIERTPD